jgi:hypothetical protein
MGLHCKDPAHTDRRPSRNPERPGTYCEDCRKEGNRRTAKREFRRLKHDVIAAYGGKCACCGESGLPFLTLDHIDGTGKEHRSSLTSSFYRWLRSNGFPPGFQVLCWNCNMGKGEGLLCPHHPDWAPVDTERPARKYAQVSEDTKRAMAQAYCAKTATQKQLAQTYNVSLSHVGRIVNDPRYQPSCKGGEGPPVGGRVDTH